MVFAAAFSVAYAGEEGKVMNNGITDFAGRTIDTLSDLSLVGPGVAEVEGANAGGIREDRPAAEWKNGITVFPDERKDAMVERSNAGGIRMEEPALPFVNGITDFSGETHDSL